MRTTLVTFICAMLVAAAVAAQTQGTAVTAQTPVATVEQVIEFYEKKVQQHPTVFAAHAAQNRDRPAAR